MHGPSSVDLIVLVILVFGGGGYLADGAVEWRIPDIEVVYPGAVDPTA
jgi:hypothetical protein